MSGGPTCSRPMVLVILLSVVIAVFILVPTLVLGLRDHSSSGKETTKVNRTDKANLNARKDTPLFIAAFNIKSFGQSKWQERYVREYIVTILSRYDVVLVQEVRDKSGQVLSSLWADLNATGTPYGLSHSERLGRSNYKEQYAFFYRTRAVQVSGTLQYNDSPDDEFEREPFTVEFKYHSVRIGQTRRIALMALHTKPEDTEKELRELPTVMEHAQKHFWQSDGVIALGDLNADCAYLSNTKKEGLLLFQTNSGFRSIIGHSVDTTVASTTDCAYDRAIVYGEYVRTTDAVVYNYQDAFSLSEADAKRISDHYPIEFKLL